MTVPKPSLELVRNVTDEHILRALMRHRRMTRAELAVETGLSKPTAGESVRRLVAAGLVADSGERTAGGRGRGRVGSYYTLAGGDRTAWAISIAPGGVVAEAVDVYGETAGRAEEDAGRTASSDQVATALRAVAERLAAASGPAELAVVSAADPVDRATGRLVHLPDAPFLVGDLDPAEVLAPYVAGEVTVDNDVNWAARAELAARPGSDTFAYLYLGEGLGCAIVSDGRVLRGRHGLAGEIAHLTTAGPGGGATPLIEVFGLLGLRRPGSTAIDVDRLLAAATGTGPRAAGVRAALGEAVRGALTAITSLADPDHIIVGGPWGQDPAILTALRDAAARHPRGPVLCPATVPAPSFAGVRADALTRLRDGVIAAPR
ncbi:ROK family transcriptional regulator [Nonomuraea jiangxiensis]|uniref:Sugar kinase of the NBD/HSP70 family, may contain an N-terminal HTH domain n=1 Tax=Nonomuraea jiangxiensis TaxID=633440 RepID=A0A1G9JTS5_9ACTN|nr:ROK family transcriptional regulator [Nonomuraea jiangxiensis]SDL41040.1 Sugar kinase of the NBD/HSP70 family, may contain an N-terminal HTH domain [Nonomuraea jiangxiensis]